MGGSVFLSRLDREHETTRDGWETDLSFVIICGDGTPDELFWSSTGSIGIGDSDVWLYCVVIIIVLLITLVIVHDCGQKRQK